MRQIVFPRMKETTCKKLQEIGAFARTEPLIEPLGNGHFVACHHPLESPVAPNGD